MAEQGKRVLLIGCDPKSDTTSLLFGGKAWNAPPYRRCVSSRAQSNQSSRMLRANDGTASIQDTERTFSLMNYFANSLGVNCTYCHNTRAFYDGKQITPQWSTASVGILMVQDINNEYLGPLKGTYPANRLGPLHGDAPKAACKTCHKGVYEPLQGLDMISDWPELATTEAPMYK